MKVYVLLADKGTQNPQGTLNLLNVGWSVTHVQPGRPTPDQAVSIFIEAEWNECNTPHTFVLELRTAEGELVMVPAINGQQALRLEQTITVPSIPGAPNGTPGRLTMLVDLQGGGLPLVSGQIYRWVVEVDGATDEQWQTSFFVTGPPPPPIVGTRPS